MQNSHSDFEIWGKSEVFPKMFQSSYNCTLLSGLSKRVGSQDKKSTPKFGVSKNSVCYDSVHFMIILRLH